MVVTIGRKMLNSIIKSSIYISRKLFRGHEGYGKMLYSDGRVYKGGSTKKLEKAKGSYILSSKTLL
jgi:hypothetical protein